MIPAGTCTWTSAVQWTDKSIWVIGAGIGSTVISVNGNAAFGVTGNSNAKASYRISGMTITGTTTDSSQVLYLSSMGSSSLVYGWRIDHIKFDFSTTNSAIAIMVTGVSAGLIDHMTFQGGSYLGVAVIGHTNPEWESRPRLEHRREECMGNPHESRHSRGCLRGGFDMELERRLQLRRQRSLDGRTHCVPAQHGQRCLLPVTLCRPHRQGSGRSQVRDLQQHLERQKSI